MTFNMPRGSQNNGTFFLLVANTQKLVARSSMPGSDIGVRLHILCWSFAATHRAQSQITKLTKGERPADLSAPTGHTKNGSIQD